MDKREQIIAEYLSGDFTYRELEKKHGIDFRTIHSWVMKNKGKDYKKESKSILKTVDTPADSKEVQRLKKELSTAQLHAKLLNTIIDLAEKELKIDIRKKSGTKR
jgi:transposase-like protein